MDENKQDSGVNAQLDSIEKGIKDFTTKAAETDKEVKLTKEQLEQSKKELDETKAIVKKMQTDAEANQKALDTLIAKQKDIPSGNGYNFKTFEDVLEEGLTKEAQNLKDHKGGVRKIKGFGIDMGRKAVGTMASATSLTGSLFVAPSIVPGVVEKLYEQNHVRNFIPVGRTDSNLIRYIQDNGGEGGPTTVAEGAAKPQVDRDLATVDAPVRKIATYFRVPDEMIDDIPYLSSFLTQMGLEELRAVEDTQLLYGDGTGTNISGFNTSGTAFAAGASIIGASANEFDVIGASKKQIRVAKINGPFVAFLNPLNYFDMRYKRKDTTNNYIFQAPSLSPLNQPLQADGVQIVENNSVTAGDFFVFSPMAAMIFDRKGVTVNFYDQDQDNAIKNLITIVIEERLALAIFRPLGIIRGTIAAAITDLTS